MDETLFPTVGVEGEEYALKIVENWFKIIKAQLDQILLPPRRVKPFDPGDATNERSSFPFSSSFLLLLLVNLLGDV